MDSYRSYQLPLQEAHIPLRQSHLRVFLGTVTGSEGMQRTSHSRPTLFGEQGGCLLVTLCIPPPVPQSQGTPAERRTSKVGSPGFPGPG